MAKEHFAAFRPRRSNIITYENSPFPSNFRQYNQRDLHACTISSGRGRERGEGGGVRCNDTTSIGSCSTKKRTNGSAVHEPMAMQTAIARQNERGIWLCKQPLRRHISDLPYHRQPYETAAQDWLPAEALLDLFYFLVI